LILGSAGTGKSQLVKKISDELKNYTKINGHNLYMFGYNGLENNFQ